MSAVIPFTAPFDEHDTLPLFTSLTSSSSSSSHSLSLARSSSIEPSPPSPAALPSSQSVAPSATVCPLPSVVRVVLESIISWLSDPPFGHHRSLFRRSSFGSYFRLLFSCQLALHLTLLVTSIVLLAHHSHIRQLSPDDSEPSIAFRVLEQLPAWLLARSAVSVVLSARRLWLGERWESSTWEAAWVVVVMWLSTAVVASSSLVALGDSHEAHSTLYLTLWTLVALLILLLALRVALSAWLLLFFPVTALTVSLPTLPLDHHHYDVQLSSSPSKPQPHQGLTPQQLQAMPSSLCSVKREDSCCAVCMDDVEVGQMERVLRCGHCFHQPCIDQWLLKKRVCPLCVRAVRPSQSRSSAGEWVVEMADIVKSATRQSTASEIAAQ